jgi:hypothetical protein
MKTINSLDGLPPEFRGPKAGSAALFPVLNKSSRMREHNALPLREAIPLCFAVSSPLIGLVIGFLGAWFVSWLTS